MVLKTVIGMCLMTIAVGGVGTATVTLTESGSLSDTVTESLSLPTKTISNSKSVSYSDSLSGSESGSFSESKSISSLSITQSRTVSLPTSSSSMTMSMSLPTISSSMSVSNTLRRYNFSMDISSNSFVEGQEVRIQIKTISPTDGTASNYFNTSDDSSVAVKVFEWSASSGGDNCNQYLSSSSPLQTRNGFGLSLETETNQTHVDAAHITIDAPSSSTPFVICFKADLADDPFWDTQIPDWTLFQVGDVFIFTSKPSNAWYNIPEPSVGQYAIIQLLSLEEHWNFTYSPSSCGSSDTNSLMECGSGDSLKIVPKGNPCTYEFQSPLKSYLGSSFIENNGTWSSDGSIGLIEGSTSGGMGIFGTQYGNPLVDSWSSWGLYNNVNSFNLTVLPTSGSSTKHSYAYVRLPKTVGNKFEICFSSREERILLKEENRTGIDQIPVWRKLYSCTADCVSGSGNSHFTMIAEEVGWSMVDLTPGTWGEIIFDDSGGGKLSTITSESEMEDPITSTAVPLVRQHRRANYWSPQGGDYFRLVASTHFTESTSSGRDQSVPFGSSPSVGCWYRESDITFGYIDRGALHGMASRDLMGDPTVGDGNHSSHSQLLTYSSLYVPSTSYSQWNVCYRRTCTSGSNCIQHTGMRVLPFHYSKVGSTPTKWLHLNEIYLPATLSEYSTMLVPQKWGEQTLTYPPEVSWYINDTRAGTWGPIIISVENQTLATLDSRPWNHVRSWNEGDNVMMTKGSVLRIVPINSPCDYPLFKTEVSASENRDGGMVECNNADSSKHGTGCDGSSSDIATANSVAFYVQLPFEVANYRICFRLSGWNWREVSPWGGRVAINDVDNPMPSGGYLSRDQWTQPSVMSTTSSATPTLSVVESRSGIETLFLITDIQSELSTAPRLSCSGGCDNSGDVLRLVLVSSNCDINPSNWNPLLADTYLSLYCPTEGYGNLDSSGLYNFYQQTACTEAEPIKKLCKGSGCWGAADTTELTSHLRQVSHIFDDIVPGDFSYWNHHSVAAVVRLPEYNSEDLSGNYYKICYKQTGYSNWMILRHWEVTPAVTITVTPSPGSVLVGGEMIRFQLSIPEGLLNSTIGTPLVNSFRAKLIKSNPKLENNNCLGTAFGIASATSELRFESESIENAYFFLKVPLDFGEYHLCVQIQHQSSFNVTNSTMSWWNPGSYSIVDNGVRWFVTAGNQPTNSALSVISFIKCTQQSQSGICDPSSNSETFDTDNGKDAVKIISIRDVCSSGDRYVAFYGGKSLHVGLEHDNSRFGIIDLGPANGPTDVAIIKTTLPQTSNDVGVEYRVCVKSVFSFVDQHPRWVEVSQGSQIPNQFVVRNPTTLLPSFFTSVALIKSWSLDQHLSPHFSLYNGVDSTTVALGGAATQFVSNPSSSGAVDRVVGFWFNSYSSSDVVTSSNDFKLVLVKQPSHRLPESESTTWGQVDSWETLEDGDCSGPAVDSATNHFSDCSLSSTSRSTAVCPSLSSQSGSDTKIFASFHIPLSPGQYKVCYRISHSSLLVEQPWMWIPSEGGHSFLYSHPSFLEFEADSAGTNISALDMRVTTEDSQSGTETSLASWCSFNQEIGGGIACFDQNSGGFTTDLITVVNGSEMCSSPADRSSPSDWFQLLRVSNTTSMVWNTLLNSFTLPPVYSGLSERFKICVYKAGEATPAFFDSTFGSKRVSKQGIVYQLHNNGPLQNGGGSGYWRSKSSGQAAMLSVSTDVSFDSELQFTEFTNLTDISTRYSVMSIPIINITSPLSQKVSRTPLLSSGSTVTYTIRVATTGGVIVPFGSHVVDVQRCASATTMSGLQCSLWYGPDTEIGVPFKVIGLGTCSGTHSANYGWPTNGLRQVMINGFLVMRLQYRSVCPNNDFGCGVRFSADSNSLLSSSYWINIQERSVYFISIDSVTTMSEKFISPKNTNNCGDTNAECFMKTCFGGQLCSIAFQAFRKAPELAPNGTISLSYSYFDYQTSSIPSEVDILVGRSLEPLPKSVSWNHEGVFTFSFTPHLLVSEISGFIFLNVTYGDSWTRFIIQIKRLLPAEVRFVSVMPLDVKLEMAGERVPSPGFIKSSVQEMNSIKAVEGSYIDCLIPYKVRFHLFNSNGIQIPLHQSSLIGWSVTALVDETDTLSKVLGVPLTDVYSTSVASLSTLVNSSLHEDGVSLFINFRVYVADNKCSRFTGGCKLLFKLSHTSTAVSDVKGYVVSPVRIPASTLTTSFDKKISVIREGIIVTVEPGTHVGSIFVRDEYHFGEFFALIYEPGLSNDGATNRDMLQLLADGSPKCAFISSNGNDCSVFKYPSQILDGDKWGARWIMRPNKPCYGCQFTFHSTWGAGPESFRSSDSQSSVLTWKYEAVELKCSPSTGSPKIVNFFENSSDTFDVEIVANAVSTSKPIIYAKWWVFTDTIKDVRTVSGNVFVLKSVSATTSIISVRMNSSIALFSGLYLEGTAPSAGVVEQLIITFHATGSGITGTQVYSCQSEIHLQLSSSALGSNYVKVSSSSGNALCSVGAVGCVNISKDVDAFSSEGVTINFEFRSKTPIADVIKSNVQSVTVIPNGGPSTTPKGSSPDWVTENGKSVSSDVTLDSVFNNNIPEDVGGFQYSFGSIQVKAERLVSSGVGSLTLRYGSAAAATPVRQTTFDICETSVNSDGVEIVTSLCVTINLWILAVEANPIGIAIEAEPSPGRKFRGGSSSCGLSPDVSSLLIFSYFRIASVDIRFYVYEVTARYSLSVSNSRMVLLESVEENNILTVGNAVSDSDLLRVTHGMSSQELKVNISFYVTEIVGSETDQKTIDIKAMLTRTGLTQSSLLSTTGSYFWEDPIESYAKWSVSDNITTDVECPSKRLFQSISHNYLSFSPTPGFGWEYARAAVDVPFPIETIVTTAQQTRAWTYSDTLVRVTKYGWGRCSTGGKMTVLELNPSKPSDGMILRSGDLRNFTEKVNSAVSMSRGVAIPWISFDQPCEGCRIKLDLCYVGQNAESCLNGFGISSEQSNRIPLLSGRTKLSKSFNVEINEPSLVAIRAQRVPELRKPVKVGELFELEVENIQLMGTTTSWAMRHPSDNNWMRTISIQSEWIDTNKQISSSMKYGNGAFLSDGSLRPRSALPACTSLSPEDFSSASYSPTLIQSQGVVSFYYSRSCSKCSIWLEYKLSKHGASDKFGRFLLRSYLSVGGIPTVGATLEHHVITCGVSWIIAGNPPVAVRRRKPFSLSAWQVDSNNIPDWDTTSTDIGFSMVESLSSGNGGGSKVVITSPSVSSYTSSVDGTATVRAYFDRSCFKCLLRFGRLQWMTVLTDPTQIILIPTSRKTLWFTNITTTGEWNFEVYAADDLGDRAYIVAGPTVAAFRPMFASRFVSNSVLTLKSNPELLIDAKMSVPAGQVPLSFLTMGSPTGGLSNGTSVYNGIPIPAGDGAAGTTILSLSGSPVVSFRVHLQMSGVGTLPTSYLGDKTIPLIHFSPVATHIAVDNVDVVSLSCSRTAELTTGQSCYFLVYSIARKPNALSSDTTWYLSYSKITSPARASVTCSSDASQVVSLACDVTVSSEAFFVEGKAKFFVRALSIQESCSCEVIITPPLDLLNATDQSITLKFKQSVVSLWDWSSSNTLEPVRVSSSLMSAPSVTNRSVSLMLRAWDSTRTHSGLGQLSNSWSRQVLTVTGTFMSPQDCFNCEVLTDAGCQVTVLEGGDVAEIKGYFTRDGVCSISPGAVSGLPIGMGTVNPTSTLDVTVRSSSKIAIIPRSEANFSNLTATADNGESAAVVGVGSDVTIQVLTSDGQRVLGDNQMVVKLTGYRNITSSEQSTWPIQTAISKNGIIIFTLNASEPTRRCNFSDGSSNLCEHVPWYFTVEATDAVVSGSSVANVGFGSISDIGPLIFVRQATRLRVRGLFPAQTEVLERVIDHTTSISWVFGVPFDMWVEAVDITGTVVRHSEDRGSSAVVFINPTIIPCVNIDNLYQHCTASFSCPFAAISALGCSSSSWTINHRLSSAGLEFTLVNGRHHIGEVVYHGRALSVPTTLLFTTLDLGDEDAFSARISIQKIKSLGIENQQCHNSVCPMVMSEVKSETEFHISIAVLDEKGETVSGDYQSTVVVGSSCVPFSHGSFVGVYKNDTQGSQFIDVLSSITMRVSGGVANFKGLVFNNNCPSMRLHFKCVSGSNDTYHDCEGKTFDTNSFIVTGVSVLALKPPPLITGLSLGSFGTASDVAIFAEGLKRDDFESKMFELLLLKVVILQSVTLRYICALPVTRWSGGVTDSDRQSPSICKDFRKATDCNSTNCVNFRPFLPLSPLNPNSVFAMSEFDVQTVISINTSLIGETIKQSISDDLLSKDSVLRKAPNGMFSNADPSLVIGVYFYLIGHMVSTKHEKTKQFLRRQQRQLHQPRFQLTVRQQSHSLLWQVQRLELSSQLK